MHEARRTKIVATIGPASEQPSVLDALIEAGMDVARIGFAHGRPEEHFDKVRAVRAAAVRQRRPVGVLVDLPGPKIRTGTFDGPQQLAGGGQVALVPGNGTSSAQRIAVAYPSLLDDLAAGDRVFLGDGGVALLVESVDGCEARASVVHGGVVQGRPGIHLPAERVRLSSPTVEDLQMIERAVAVGVDAIAISFVRSSDDMVRARAVAGPGVLLVAKIETALAVTRLDGIIDASDAVMVARGDLGTECPLEDVPHLQKRIVRACRASGRPVITATQMLESMTHALVPTRAEACDVANAVLDGTDALMLSGETAIGCDPVNAVRTMARLALRAESEVDPERGDVVSGKAGVGLPVGSDRLTSAMAHAAWRAALDANASAILCCTWSGATVRALARYRPAARLVALSPQEPVLRQLAMSWGAAACHLPACTTTDEMVTRAIDVARDAGYVRVGDVAVVLAGSPHDDAMAATDVLRLLCVT